MPAPKNLDPGQSPLHFFGCELRHHRTTAGLTQEQLGGRVNYSGDLISKIETGQLPPTPDFAQLCDTELGTGGALARLMAMVRWGTFPAPFRPWLEVERETRTLRSWELTIVPGLLQTADYARALLWMHPGATDERVEEQVAARLERQQILGRDEPPLLWFLVAEDALRYQVGGPAIMRGQLKALVDASGRTNVAVQVVPMSAGAHLGHVGAFALASFDGSPDVVYLENARTGQVTDQPEDVQAITDIYDAIRVKALPDHASLDLITKVMEQWS